MLDDNLSRIELDAYVRLQFEDFGFLKDSDEKFRGVDKATIKAYRKELRNIHPTPPLIPKALPNKRLEVVKGELIRKRDIENKRNTDKGFKYKEKNQKSEKQYLKNNKIYKRYANKKVRQNIMSLPTNQRAGYKKLINFN